MDDFMMFKYLKEHGMLGHSSISEKYEKYMEDQHKVWSNAVPAHKDVLEHLAKHFDYDRAKHIVSTMYHTEGDRKYIGEKFCIDKAKEVCEEYRHLLPSHITYIDVYIAINAQYHDYIKLFKTWFSEDLECKIIESAIMFWFMDEDYNKDNKVTSYFQLY